MTDAETVAFACAALSNLCTDPHSAVAFTNEQLTALADSMRSLLEKEDYASSHLAAQEALGKLSATLESGEKQREKLRRAAASRTASRAKAAEWERSLRERALDMASQ